MSSEYWDFDAYKCATLTIVPDELFTPPIFMGNDHYLTYLIIKDYRRLKTPGKNLWMATWGDGINALIPVWKDYKKPSIKVVAHAYYKARFARDYGERMLKLKKVSENESI